MTDAQVQWALFIGSGLAIYLTQCPGEIPKYACIVGLLAQPFWFYETYVKKQWGIFALTVWYTFTWLQGLWVYWL